MTFIQNLHIPGYMIDLCIHIIHDMTYDINFFIHNSKATSEKGTGGAGAVAGTVGESLPESTSEPPPPLGSPSFLVFLALLGMGHGYVQRSEGAAVTAPSKGVTDGDVC